MKKMKNNKYMFFDIEKFTSVLFLQINKQLPIKYRIYALFIKNFIFKTF